MPLNITNNLTFTQIHNELKNTKSNTDKTIRSDGTQLYVRKGIHNANPSSSKLDKRQTKYDSGAQTIRTALEHQVGKARSDEILQNVGLLTKTTTAETMATRLKRSDLNKIQAQIDIQSLKSQFGTDRANRIITRVNQQIAPRELQDGITDKDKLKIQAQVNQLNAYDGEALEASESLDLTIDTGVNFQDDITQNNGVTHQFLRDIVGSSDYTVGGTTFSNDKSGVELAVRQMFIGDPKMLAAVSRACQQGTLGNCASALNTMLNPIKVATRGKDQSLDFEIQKQPSGDVLIKIAQRVEITSIFDMASGELEDMLTGDDSFFSSDITIRLKADEVAGDNPVAHIEDSHINYQINPGPPTVSYA